MCWQGHVQPRPELSDADCLLEIVLLHPAASLSRAVLGGADVSSWCTGPPLQPDHPQPSRVQRGPSQSHVQPPIGASSDAGAAAQVVVERHASFCSFSDLHVDDELDELLRWSAEAELQLPWSHEDPYVMPLGPSQPPALGTCTLVQFPPQPANDPPLGGHEASQHHAAAAFLHTASWLRGRA